MPGSVRKAGRPRRARSGFSLIEILVVVFITLIVAGLAAPSFSRALKGQRLRTSARAVVTAHKYARNMAVLRQQPMALVIDRMAGEIDIVSVADRSGLSARGGFLEQRQRQRRDPDAAKDRAPEEPADAAPPARMETIETRMLGSEVRVAGFESDGDYFHRDGVYWVNYYPSGMSDGFTLRLEDDNRNGVTVVADAISGGAEVKLGDDR